jgi:hypothetical protein
MPNTWNLLTAQPVVELTAAPVLLLLLAETAMVLSRVCRAQHLLCRHGRQHRETQQQPYLLWKRC